MEPEIFIIKNVVPNYYVAAQIKNNSMIFQEAGNGKLFAAGKHKLQNFILTISAFQS